MSLMAHSILGSLRSVKQRNLPAGYATHTLTGGVAGINDSSLTRNDGKSAQKTRTPYAANKVSLWMPIWL
jgi:hypothetical protein